ncbi:hypothetical protein [Solidesulfovibrio sp.]|uniref:hypothetical protein n=1 Tax=Solidesulfovibrio sp. TaxID=2910990 RepID=UPI0026113B85|nr:hypothetical protein [Solidesulfovibrio sp.]
MATPEPKRPRSTQPDFTPPTAFADAAAELAYYKDECRRLKAIIALQKQKIRKLVTQRNGRA